MFNTKNNTRIPKGIKKKRENIFDNQSNKNIMKSGNAITSTIIISKIRVLNSFLFSIFWLSSFTFALRNYSKK